MASKISSFFAAATGKKQGRKGKEEMQKDTPPKPPSQVTAEDSSVETSPSNGTIQNSENTASVIASDSSLVVHTSPNTGSAVATSVMPASSPTTHIEDKYFNFGVEGSVSPQTLVPEKPSSPPAKVVSKGPSAVAEWYKSQAAILKQQVSVSQQRNQMLVQKVLEIRRRAGSPTSGGNNIVTPSAQESARNKRIAVTATPSPSNFTSLLHVEELAPSPMTMSVGKRSAESGQSEGKTAWLEMKLQRSQQNFHELSKRTREMESNNAKAAQMIIDLRAELQGQRDIAEAAVRREADGRNLVAQLNSHVESLSQQLAGVREQYRTSDVRVSQAEERAARWKRERREIGGYALRLEKSEEVAKAELIKIKAVVEKMAEELREAQSALQNAGEKIKAQEVEIGRLQSGGEADRQRLHKAVSAGVLSLQSELGDNRPHRSNEFAIISSATADEEALSMTNIGNHHVLRLKRNLEESARALEKRNAEVQALETRNEVLTVRSQHATRALEEYREKSRKLQEIVASGLESGSDEELARYRGAAATAEAQLLTARRDADRCREELKQVLMAMEAARDRVAQSKDSMDSAERKSAAARAAVRDAEAEVRSIKRQLEVVNEDCVATKRELGALQADNAHLEQQLVVAQRNFAKAKKSRESLAATNKAIEAQLEISLERAQAAIRTVSHFCFECVVVRHAIFSFLHRYDLTLSIITLLPNSLLNL